MQTENISTRTPKIIGLAALFIAVIVIIWPEVFSSTLLANFFSGPFLICYFLSLAYLGFIVLRHIILKGWNIFKIEGDLIRIFVLLFSISGFALNISMNMFAEPVLWLKVYFVIIFSAVILFLFKEHFSEQLYYFLYFAFGMGFIISVYFSVVLLPMAGFGLAFFWIFGISLHGMLPLIWLTLFSLLFFLTKNRNLRYSYIAGIIIPLVFTSFFMFQWDKTRTIINDYNTGNTEYPQWVSVSQQINDNDYSQWVLKSGIINETRTSWGNFDPWMGASMNNIKRHDPLTMICRQLIGDINLDGDLKAKILESDYKFRHQAIPRYWSGNHLSVKTMNTSVQLMPKFRLAYTEKKISISNTNNDSWWRPDEEAIFSFYLPEGSIVNSLSLWINGKEEKARVTTPEKADSAYEAIVGYEMRDPSMVSWQEGNRIIVRVFPCPPDQERIFKIGFASPLAFENNKLTYKNIYFEGPAYDKTKEEISLTAGNDDSMVSSEIPSFFSKNGENYSYSGKYQTDWAVVMPSCDLSNGYFSLNNKSYRAEEIKYNETSLKAENIYLDINKSWSENEFNEIYNLCKGKNIYVFCNEIIKIDDNNKSLYFSNLHQLNFTLFPLYMINYPEKSIIITKSGSDSPTLADTENSNFYTSTYQYVSIMAHPVCIFSLNDHHSSYLKTLKEFGLVNLYTGDVKTLSQYLNSGKFPTIACDTNVVTIEAACMQIVCDTLPKGGNAPDILMRMFAYKQIMQKSYIHYFMKNEIPSELFSYARESHIVSPVSDLIVLETIEDYERFDIPENNSGLSNASDESYGSVPEPHEWVLIIMSLLIAAYFTIKRLKLF
jgi:XrtN system VIT domain protein